MADTNSQADAEAEDIFDRSMDEADGEVFCDCILCFLGRPDVIIGIGEKDIFVVANAAGTCASF